MEFDNVGNGVTKSPQTIRTGILRLGGRQGIASSDYVSTWAEPIVAAAIKHARPQLSSVV
jgi:hypothetical protein